MLRKELDMEFKELKDGDQSRIRNEINKQLEAGTAFTAKKSKAVNCKGIAPFKTIDKKGNKIAQGDRCTFWMNPKTGIARLYVLPVKAEKVAVEEKVKAGTNNDVIAKILKLQAEVNKLVATIS